MRVPDDPGPGVSEQGASEAVGHGTLSGREASLFCRPISGTLDERAERRMPKKGCSPDNSACEGFFGRLKDEMFYGRSWQDVSIDEFIKILDDYMYWYAEERIKISLGGISPIQYRRQLGLTA